MFRPHHLELFYYVARYGGISAAVRHIPYSIGQPAVSGQMADFEREVGVRLFHRRPFQLTEPGLLIYRHVRPFHEQLATLWAQVQGQPVETLRIAAAGSLGPEILSVVLEAAAPLPGDVRFELLTGCPAELEAWVLERRVQLAITPVDRRVTRVCSRVIAQPGLRLLVPRKSRISSAGFFWGRPRIAEPLICPPETDPVSRRFASGLQGLRVEWNAGFRVEALSALMQLVAGGHGVGVGLDLPWSAPPPSVRALPLPGFAPVPLLLLWRKPVSPLLQSLLTAADAVGRRFQPGSAGLLSLLSGPCVVWFDDWVSPLGLAA